MVADPDPRWIRIQVKVRIRNAGPDPGVVIAGTNFCYFSRRKGSRSGLDRFSVSTGTGSLFRTRIHVKNPDPQV